VTQPMAGPPATTGTGVVGRPHRTGRSARWCTARITDHLARGFGDLVSPGLTSVGWSSALG